MFFPVHNSVAHLNLKPNDYWVFRKVVNRHNNKRAQIILVKRAFWKYLFLMAFLFAVIVLFFNSSMVVCLLSAFFMGFLTNTLIREYRVSVEVTKLQVGLLG